MATRTTPTGKPGTRTAGTVNTGTVAGSLATQPGGAQATSLSQEKIAMRAYEKWCQRGCPDGTAEQDWYEAETELRTEQERPGQQPGR